MDKLDDPVLAALSPSERFESPRKTKRVLRLQQPDKGIRRDPEMSSYSWEGSTQARPEPVSLSYSLSKEKLEEYNGQRSPRDCGDSFGSTSNSTSSGVPDYSSEDEDADGLTMGSQGAIGLGIVAERTSLPKRPTIVIPSAKRTESAALERYLSTPDTALLDESGKMGYVH